MKRLTPEWVSAFAAVVALCVVTFQSLQINKTLNAAIESNLHSREIDACREYVKALPAFLSTQPNGGWLDRLQFLQPIAEFPPTREPPDLATTVANEPINSTGIGLEGVIGLDADLFWENISKRQVMLSALAELGVYASLDTKAIVKTIEDVAKVSPTSGGFCVASSCRLYTHDELQDDARFFELAIEASIKVDESCRQIMLGVRKGLI